MIHAMTIERKRQATFALAAVLLSAAGVATLVASTGPASANPQDKWCKDVHLRFFVGGAEGDAFASIVYNGAKQAEHDLGPTVDYIFSGWDEETMVQQLREAVAAKPDGIAMMGHPGEAAIMPLAEEASKVRHQDDVPERAGCPGRRQVWRRLCRRAAGRAGQGSGRGNGSNVSASRAATRRSCSGRSIRPER